MRKILLSLLAAFSMAGCANDEKSGCEFTKATLTITQVGKATPMQNNEVSDCFRRSTPDETGLVEIKGEKTAEKFKVLYYQVPEGEPLEILTLKFANVSSDWRAKKGHDIMKVDKPDTLAFIFGDRKVAKVKGTVIFTK
jgi:hypothetical protein